MQWKYLKKTNIGFNLDHRLTPEVRALFAAMASRLPEGGIEARYKQVVEKIAQKSPYWNGPPTGHSSRETALAWAESQLTTYPLHPVVQEFFDEKVKNYGHSSVLELTGSPDVYVQGVSPFTAYLSFDSPLVAGQEFSTRAVRRRDWPMCREAFVPARGQRHAGPDGIARESWDFGHGCVKPHPELEALHEGWLEVFEAEVEAWKVELRKPCELCDGYAARCGACYHTGKKYPFIKDPQAFRPALDRARWAIPSTIATGFCHTAHVRAMGRVIQTGMDFSAKKVRCTDCNGVGAYVSWDENGNSNLPCEYCEGRGTWSEPSKVWQDIQDAYEEALPGMKGMWLREAVATTGEADEKGVPSDSAVRWEGDSAMPGGHGPIGVEGSQEGDLPRVQDAGAVSSRRPSGTDGSGSSGLPGHLKIGFVPPGDEVSVEVSGVPIGNSFIRLWLKNSPPAKAYQRKPRGYLDPMWNQLVQVDIEFQCSWAVARDWHRHRTAYPWHLNIVTEPDAEDPADFVLHSAYKPISDCADEEVVVGEGTELEYVTSRHAALMSRSFDLFEQFRKAGDMEKAMLCLPFGATVSMRTTMGLRDAVYMLELRANAHGANFEYEAQAKEALRQLKEQLGPELCEIIFPEE